MNSKKYLLAPLLVSVMALAGCSGEPSAGDVEKLIMQDLERQNAQLRSMGMGQLGEAYLPQIHSVKKIACEGKDKVYTCDVEIDSSAMGVRDKSVAKMRIVKSSDGWMLSQ
jgi:hypothetical protein